MKGLKYILAIFAIGFLTVACEETDYMTYDTSHNGVYFEEDSVYYSFGPSSDDVTSRTIEIPVKIMGMVSKDATRNINYEVVGYSVKNPDGTDKIIPAVEGVHYHISTDAIVEPNSIIGYISIDVLRNALEGNYNDGYKHYGVKLVLKSNDNFTPTLTPADQTLIFTFDNAIEKPWKDGNGDPFWSESLYGKWHPYKYILMVDAFHDFKNQDLGRYEEMLAAYGENLEKMLGGDPYPYATAFRKYIMLPVYEYLRDRKDEVLAKYPDFPKTIKNGVEDGTLDFPNPFPSLNP